MIYFDNNFNNVNYTKDQKIRADFFCGSILFVAYIVLIIEILSPSAIFSSANISIPLVCFIVYFTLAFFSIKNNLVICKIMTIMVSTIYAIVTFLLLPLVAIVYLSSIAQEKVAFEMQILDKFEYVLFSVNSDKQITII